MNSVIGEYWRNVWRWYGIELAMNNDNTALVTFVNNGTVEWADVIGRCISLHRSGLVTPRTIRSRWHEYTPASTRQAPSDRSGHARRISAPRVRS